MTVVMSGGQAVLVGIDTVDGAGVHQPVHGVPQWSSNDPTNLVVSPYPDGYGAHIAAKDSAVGTFTVTVTADGDLGPGVRQISGVLDFDVRAVDAATEIQFTVGEPF